jgi:hypothetical protein
MDGFQMKYRKAMLCLAIGYGLSASVYANQADTFSQCTQSSVFGGQWMSSSFFKTCLLSPYGTTVLESRIEQTKNYFPIDYALKFVNGSSATIRLSLIDEKYCKNPSEEVMLSAKQEVYSGRTCIFLKSHRGIAIEVVATNWAPSVLRARRRLISSFRFQINSFYCTSFVQQACSSFEYLSVRFRFDEGSLGWGSSKRFDLLSPQIQTWRLPTEMP